MRLQYVMRRLRSRIKARLLAFTAAVVPAAGVARAQSGEVHQHVTFTSKVLGADVRYSVYLPTDYGVSTRRYPVLYLLHGRGDDDTAWLQNGEANRTADDMIASGELAPMIIVMPNAQLSWYVNDFTGKVPWEDMFVKEFMPEIERQYRTQTGKGSRAVAGLSMGGFGALLFAMHHPDLFGSAAALSAAIFTDDEVIAAPQRKYDGLFGDTFGDGRVGQARLTDHWRNNSVMDLARTLPLDTLRSFRWYIDCGDDDDLSTGNAALHILLAQRKIPHQYRVWDGGHNWNYWRAALPDVLRFVAQGFGG